MEDRSPLSDTGWMVHGRGGLPRLPLDDGAVGSLLRGFDWSRTGLGPIERWPASLRAMAAMVLENRFPMNLLWGPDLLQVYNEAYTHVLADKHPAAMARPAPEVWHEIWHIIGPQFQRVLGGHGATWNDKLLLPLVRKGFLEETYFTFSYSPVRDDEGGIGGVLVTCQETTADVQGERQLEMLRDLGAQPAMGSARAACQAAAEILARNDADIPFALLYLVDRARDRASLVARGGHDGHAWPTTIDRITTDEDGPWPLFAVEPGSVHVLDDLAKRVGPLPAGRWGTPERAVVVALTGAGQARPYGYLVAGVSPLRALDDRYKELFRLAADQIALGLARVFAYEEERQRAEALAEIDRAKTVFFSNVSHELRTPLTLMLGPLAEARATPEGALGGAALDMVQRNALRLLKLVNGLLDFARIEAGRTVASYEPTDLSTLTAELSSVFRSAAESAGLSLRVDCPPLESPVFVDRDMWEKIVLNLLSNALKFTFEGEIAVSLARVGASVELAVRDTGTGIARDELPRIFDRFHRSKGARSRTHEGTGIGLSLVQELAKLHGGSVGVDSQLGVGTTFRVRIPLGSAHLPAEHIALERSLEPSSPAGESYVDEALGWSPAANAKREPWVGATPDGAPHVARVLVADDNADMRSYLQQLLGKHWQVECVADGVAALNAATENTPDLVLADVMMPGLDGFELLRRLRGQPATRDLPIILLSARAGEEARVEGIEAGADDYMIKPFSARELGARVQMHLSLARVRRAGLEALRQSEERFRALVTASSDLVFRMSADWSEMRLLQGRELIADARSPTKSWLEKYIHPDHRAQVTEAIACAIHDKSAFQLEHRVLRKDGSIGWTLSRAVPLFDAHGEIIEWFGAAVDVSERKHAEQQLREADRRKDEFLAMLGHELRNPLAAIRNATELLNLLAAADSRLLRVHGVLERQSTQMARLIDGLLEISRIAQGKIQLQRAAIDVRDVLKSVIEDRGALLEASGLSLRLNQSDEPLWIWADKVRLAQVFDNLLGNAMKFTRAPGSIELMLSRDGDAAVVRVRDTGVGIRPEMLPRLFQPFQQEAQDIAREAGGLGLGLALARGLIELHGGTVEALSDGPGTGAEFRVRLPLGEPPSQSSRARSIAPATARSVLIVEDNVDAGETLRALLELRGHDVAVALSGAEALELLRQRRADIVLCDLGLPTMSGYEVARAVRADATLRDVHLVALTGYGQPEDRRRSAEAGFDAHLVKPVDLKALDGVLVRASAPRPR
jgi:signal transduction histidine kinase/DNA-binding response OmpR family regulator